MCVSQASEGLYTLARGREKDRADNMCRKTSGRTVRCYADDSCTLMHRYSFACCMFLSPSVYP